MSLRHEYPTACGLGLQFERTVADWWECPLAGPKAGSA
jgi:hypothetical protein